MEKFPVLRRFPKRLLYLTFAMLGACALFTLYIESDGRSLLTATVHIERYPNNNNSPPGWSLRRKQLITSNNNNTGRTLSIISPNNLTHKSSSDPATSSSSSTESSRASAGGTTTPLQVSDTCNSPVPEDSKLILLWTGFFDYWDYLPKENFEKCEKCRNCRVTRDRKRLKESDAVIFHCRDMSVSDVPAVRYPHQRWVFYCLESPPYSDFPGLLHMKNMFNWTMTYRSDSDIVTQYGTVKRVRPSRPLDLSRLLAAFANKSRSAVWMSSHCPTAGGRDDYVRELRRHLDVDVYGTCGASVCAETARCLSDFAASHRFFLAFENTVCRDYVTEKFFRTLRYDMVPVVFGGADYAKVAPPGSYVDALSFRSPRHLAFFLAGVGRDFGLYASYFKWRADFEVGVSNRKECGLCELLHAREAPPSSYPDLRKWWVDDSMCRTWTPSS